jgi:sRNA-binding regulator protein Hfq
MKKTVILLLISLLFQSCFTHTRALDFKAGAVVEKQKVKIYKNNGTELKGKVLSADKDQITITASKTKQVVKTPVKDILGVQNKRVSLGKSIGVPAAAILTAILLYAIFGDQPSSSVDNQ